MVRQMLATILAGGYGKRLRPITNKIPKNMIDINGKPIIMHQIEWLKNQGFKRFLILVSYMAEKIMSYLKDGSNFGIEIIYSRETEPLGTGGAIKNAYEHLIDESKFLLVNGDIITNLNIYSMIEALKTAKETVGVLSSVPLQSPYGIIEFDIDGWVSNFREKPLLEEYWINAGVYVFKNEVLDYLPEKGDLERATLPMLAKDGRLKVVKYMGVLWRSIDSIKDLEYVSNMLRSYEDIVNS